MKNKKQSTNKFNLKTSVLFILIISFLGLTTAYSVLLIEYKINSTDVQIDNYYSDDTWEYRFELKPSQLKNSIQYYEGGYYFNINILKYDVSYEITKIPLPIETLKCEFYFSEIINNKFVQKCNVIFSDNNKIKKKILLSL